MLIFQLFDGLQAAAAGECCVQYGSCTRHSFAFDPLKDGQPTTCCTVYLAIVEVGFCFEQVLETSLCGPSDLPALFCGIFGVMTTFTGCIRV